jgi:RNA-directed DNA polymerase
LSRGNSPQWVLEGDIESCFDRINHDWLLANVCMEQSVLRKWLKAGFMDRSMLHPTDEGTPQGGIISPVLANLTLDGLEKLLSQHFPKHRGQKVNLVRYADDFVITGATPEVLSNEVRPLVERFLAARGLRLSPTKTVVTHVDMGFDFLGQNVRKYRGKLLIMPSRRSVRAFLGKVREVIRKCRTAATADLLLLLNPMIRGWAHYHRHVVSSRCFHNVDHAIWSALWLWARRRHRGRSLGWVKAKYFPAHGGHQWVFTGAFNKRSGKTGVVRLVRARSVLIRRHRLIRGDANPFDPRWDGYFHRRRFVDVEPRLWRAFAEA